MEEAIYSPETLKLNVWSWSQTIPNSVHELTSWPSCSLVFNGLGWPALQPCPALCHHSFHILLKTGKILLHFMMHWKSSTGNALEGSGSINLRRFSSLYLNTRKINSQKLRGNQRPTNNLLTLATLSLLNRGDPTAQDNGNKLPRVLSHDTYPPQSSWRSLSLLLLSPSLFDEGEDSSWAITCGAYMGSSLCLSRRGALLLK